MFFAINGLKNELHCLSRNRRTYAFLVLIFILPKSTQQPIFTLFPCLWLASNSVNVKIKTKPRCASLLCDKNCSAKLRSSVSALPSHTQVQRSAQLVSISTSSTSLTFKRCYQSHFNKSITFTFNLDVFVSIC